MSKFEAFTHIEQFKNAVYAVNRYVERTNSLYPMEIFRGYPKLHGTNAGVRRTLTEQGPVYQAQARKRDITVFQDNFGFAAFIAGVSTNDLEVLFQRAFSAEDLADPENPTFIYGEWYGQGINSRAAVTKLPKAFALFSKKTRGQLTPIQPEIRAPHAKIYNVADAGFFEIEVDFSEPGIAKAEMDRLTLAVEAECPWGKLFGLTPGEDGQGCIGEGIVWHCVSRPWDTSLWFKTKGEEHQKATKNGPGKSKTNTAPNPEKVACIQEFVDTHLTEYRLEQGITHLKELGVPVDKSSTGQFLEYVCRDLAREEGDVLAASDLCWKDVSGKIVSLARQFFLQRASEV